MRKPGRGFSSSAVLAYVLVTANSAFATQESFGEKLVAESISHQLELGELWENPELWQVPSQRVADRVLPSQGQPVVPPGQPIGSVVEELAVPGGQLEDPATWVDPPAGALPQPVEQPLSVELPHIETITPPPAKRHMVGFELHRDGATWLVGDGDDFGSYSLEGVSTVQIGRLEGSFSGYAVHFVGGPIQTDMPPRLFELFVGYRVIGDLNADWSYDLTISPGIYTDFEGHAHQGWRIRGLGLAKYHLTARSQLVMGVAYLDRENLKLLPVGGLVAQLNSATTLELVFPEPRLAMLVNNGKTELYFRGQLGGGSWAIERDSLANDIATYDDRRVFVGLSSENDEGKSTFFEVGYVFQRQLEYRSGVGDMQLKETLMFRSGVRY